MFRITHPSSTAQMGRAAEYLVCFDLLRRGLSAYTVPASDSAYDVVLELPHHLIRIQVKSTFAGKAIHTNRLKPHERFRFQLHSLTAKATTRDYTQTADVFAFVVLSEGLIRYYFTKDITPGCGAAFFGAPKFRNDTDSFDRLMVGLIETK